MLSLNKFNGESFLINPDLIKTIEGGGDTIVTLVTGEKVLVSETPEEIKLMFMDYKKYTAPSLAHIEDLAKV